jgi:hypothetical protein
LGTRLMGRVTVASDGTKSITPLTHSEQVFSYQKKVSALIDTAIAFKDNPTPETQNALIKAALALD